MVNIPVETQIAQMLNTYSDLNIRYTSEMIRRGRIRHLYLATQDGIVVGVVGVQKLSSHLGEINHLVVPPSLRRKGLAERLMNMALKESTTPIVMTTVREENIASYKLMMKLGFHVVESYKNADQKTIVVFMKNLARKKQGSNENRTQLSLFERDH